MRADIRQRLRLPQISRRQAGCSGSVRVETEKGKTGCRCRLQSSSGGGLGINGSRPIPPLLLITDIETGDPVHVKWKPKIPSLKSAQCDSDNLECDRQISIMGNPGRHRFNQRIIFAERRTRAMVFGRVPADAMPHRLLPKQTTGVSKSNLCESYSPPYSM